jgi:hypothetical protein
MPTEVWHGLAILFGRAGVVLALTIAVAIWHYRTTRGGRR